jgi:conjugative transposon TraK protein
MFNQFRNIESAFTHIKLFSFLFLGANMVICCYTLYTAQVNIGRVQSKVFVLSNGKLLEAAAVNRKEKLPVEIRDHVNTFHQYFFSLEPDEQLIKKQITKALYLCDASARMQYSNLSESGYYSGIVSGNISQRLETDSIQVDLNQTPFLVRYFGKLSIIRSTSVVIRSLITEAALRDLGTMSDNNPHGFLMEHWKIIENKDISSYLR